MVGVIRRQLLEANEDSGRWRYEITYKGESFLHLVYRSTLPRGGFVTWVFRLPLVRYASSEPGAARIPIDVLGKGFVTTFDEAIALGDRAVEQRMNDTPPSDRT
jgi:hypothetical protein